jgi:hypothetical protein
MLRVLDQRAIVEHSMQMLEQYANRIQPICRQPVGKTTIILAQNTITDHNEVDERDSIEINRPPIH